jgi:hypothetical protein
MLMKKYRGQKVVRKLHPNEELVAMGWKMNELSGKTMTPRQRYEAIGITICPTVYEAFVERMLWAMGKRNDCSVGASPNQVEKRTNEHGVAYYRHK